MRGRQPLFGMEESTATSVATGSEFGLWSSLTAWELGDVGKVEGYVSSLGESTNAHSAREGDSPRAASPAVGL